MSKNGTKFLKICFTHVPTSWGHVEKMGPNSWKCFAPMFPQVQGMSESWNRITEHILRSFQHAFSTNKSWHGMAWNIHDTPWHATFRTWHAKNNMTRQKPGTKFLKIFFTHVPTSWGHVKNLGPNSWTYFAPMYPLVEDMSEIYAQPPQHTPTGARAGPFVPYRSLQTGRIIWVKSEPEN